jgi:hypothetical protein
MICGRGCILPITLATLLQKRILNQGDLGWGLSQNIAQRYGLVWMPCKVLRGSTAYRIGSEVLKLTALGMAGRIISNYGTYHFTIPS